ncbi:hypothetical protein ACYZX9_14505 [Sphingomonas citri]
MATHICPDEPGTSQHGFIHSQLFAAIILLAESDRGQPVTAIRKSPTRERLLLKISRLRTFATVVRHCIVRLKSVHRQTLLEDRVVLHCQGSSRRSIAAAVTSASSRPESGGVGRDSRLCKQFVRIETHPTTRVITIQMLPKIATAESIIPSRS